MIHPLLVSITDLTNTFTLIGFPLTIAGLAAAFYQIRDAHNQAEQAGKAAKQALEAQKQQEQRENEGIHVVLRHYAKGLQIQLPATMRRGDLTRAELQGWVAILPRKSSAPYILRHMNHAIYIERIRTVRNSPYGENKELVIECFENEFDQFDVTPEPIPATETAESP